MADGRPPSSAFRNIAKRAAKALVLLAGLVVRVLLVARRESEASKES